MNKISTFLTILLLYFVSVAPSLAQTELIVDGDFEGGFGAWTTMSLGMDPDGMWDISTPGALTPISTNPTAPNPQGGSFYAVTDQTGAGTHSMYQTFTIPAGATSVDLSFDMFVNDWSGTGGIIDPIGLDHTGPANQHARVDILNAGATPFSTNPADVAMQLYIGTDGTMPAYPYQTYNFDLGSLTPGNSYIIRFASTDNQFFFNLGVDNVSILAESPPIPTMGQWGIIILGLLLIIVGVVKVASRVYNPAKI